MPKKNETTQWLSKEDAEGLRAYVLRTVQDRAAFADAARAWARRAGSVIGERVRDHQRFFSPITKEVLLVELIEMFRSEFVWYGGEAWFSTGWDAMLGRPSCCTRARTLIEGVLAALVEMGILAECPVPPEEEVVDNETYIMFGPAVRLG